MHLQNDLTYSQVMMKWSCGDGEGGWRRGGGGGREDQFHQENARVSKRRHRSAVLCHSRTYEKMCAARGGGGRYCGWLPLGQNNAFNSARRA